MQDGAKAYMRYHNVPSDMQRHVQRWYDYAWSRSAAQLHLYEETGQEMRTEGKGGETDREGRCNGGKQREGREEGGNGRGVMAATAFK